jgi:glutathione S-transferase
MLALYHSDTAVCAAKVRITLAEKDLAFESRLMNLHTGDQFKPDYLALNPNGVVPTLIHDGEVLIESTVINEYLDEVFPQVALRPADALGRARMRLWTKREDTIHDAINTMTTAILFRHNLMQKPPEERVKRYESMPDPAKRLKWKTILEEGLHASYVREALVRFAKLFADMERALAKGPCLLGETFSLADIGFISFFYRLEMLEMAGLWRTHFPLTSAWFERCKARSSFDTAIRAYISPAAVEQYATAAVPCRAQVERLFADVLKG